MHDVSQQLVFFQDDMFIKSFKFPDANSPDAVDDMF